MNVPLVTTASTVDDELWYKDAVIYQLHVKSFFDANNDGIGDFPGLISKLDYIADLGATAIWLLPFYPSPLRDDGYDISEYRGVHADYGTIADVKRLIAGAHARGIRVITELVINHTSDQHPWFQRARRAKPGTAMRNFYVWSDSDQKYSGTRIIFVDAERSNWAWDDLAGAYYWHRFYAHQPDLNFDNPRVLRAILAVMKYWFELGVDGLRLDAIPYLVEREGTSSENLPETHSIIKYLRKHLDAAFAGRILLAEANQWPEDTKEYFGDGDECQMAFHFPLMPRMYMAIAREDRFPITDIMRQTPAIPDNCQWAIFLRNHDELTLEMVTDSERDYLWETYAADRRARINLGIRRRLSPLLERDRRRVELMNSLLLSMPGTPIIYYGDEIGMGDNIHLGDRHGVRTPMQWTPDRNGGFSRADPATLVLPPIMDPLYGYQSVNVEAQSRDPHSLLNWMRRMLAVRRQHLAFGRGSLRFLYPKNRKILTYLREHRGEAILCVANVARSPQAVELDLSEFAGRIPIELNAGSLFPPIGQLTYLLTLAPYGFYWFILAEESVMPSSHTPAPEPLPEYQTIVLRGDTGPSLLSSGRSAVEHEVLPTYLAKRRWFAGKDQAIGSVNLAYVTPMPEWDHADRDRETFLAEVQTTAASGSSRWLLPLAIVWGGEPMLALPHQLALAHVRRGRSVGLLTDAFALPSFARQVIRALYSKARLQTPDGCVCFEPLPERADALHLPPDAEVIWLSAEQSNSSLIAGDAVMLKLFRRISGGHHPESEMCRHLTRQGFANAPPFLGEVVRVAPDGTRFSLAVAQGFVRNQGDAWSWMLDHLNRGIDSLGAQTPDIGIQSDDIADCVAMASTIGRRLGEMHAILARPSPEAPFAPGIATADEARSWAQDTELMLEAAFDTIERHRSGLRSDDMARADEIIRRRHDVIAAVRRLAGAGEGSRTNRIHGDFHLGQVLVASGDAYIIDFEGEPLRTIAERRAKSSPTRDVAGLLRSLQYAAATMIDQRNIGAAAVSDARRDEFIAQFLTSCRKAFLAAYEDATGAPIDRPLLHLFLIQKAAYELTYEAANRPAWLGVPLAGLAALARRAVDWGQEDGRDGA